MLLFLHFECGCTIFTGIGKWGQKFGIRIIRKDLHIYVLWSLYNLSIYNNHIWATVVNADGKVGKIKRK